MTTPKRGRALRSSKHPRSRRRPVFVAGVEQLERLVMPALFVVTTLADNGNNANPIDGSLRWAIVESNATPPPSGQVNDVTFSLASNKEIIPEAPLPTITQPIEIDATSLEATAGVPVVQLNGGSAGAQAVGLTIAASASGSIVQGLIVVDFGGDGVDVLASNVLIAGDDIGTGAGSITSYSNEGNGITARGANDTIGGTSNATGNVISNNLEDGVVLVGPFDLVLGNYIGTDYTGELAGNKSGSGYYGNGGDGVVMEGFAETVGGTASGAYNVISNNDGNGVTVLGTSELVVGNEIGTDATGEKTDDKYGNDFGNVENGVDVVGSWATIGGTSSAAGNLISVNYQNGVLLSGSDELVADNYIGVDSSGKDANKTDNTFGNLWDGVVAASGSNSDTIGGTTSADGNVISNNLEDGVVLSGSGDLVEGNKIGTDETGTSAVGPGDGAIGNEQDGVLIQGGSSDTVGGTAAGAGNLISANMYGPGVAIVDSAAPPTSVGNQSAGSGQLELTQDAYTRGAGFSLTTFATGFPEVGSIGPLGIAFQPGTGNVLVSDQDGYIRSFSDSDGQSAGSATYVGPNFGQGNTEGLAVLGSTVYMAQANLGQVVQLNANGSTQNSIAVPNAVGLVADPATGLLYASDKAGGLIYQVDPVTGTATPIFNGGDGPDGLAVDPNDGILYVANEDGLLGFDLKTGDQLFDFAISGDPDGIAVGTGDLATDVFVNTNSGTIVEVNVRTSDTVTIASGGSRGDFLTVDPTNNTLLVDQSDRILRLSPPAGGGFVGGPTVATVNNLVEGNQIGTNISGTGGLGNGQYGANNQGLDGDGILISGSQATGNTIGGTVAGACNTISANAQAGVLLAEGTTGNLLQGNEIGESETKVLGNDGDGILLNTGAIFNTIGGTVAGSYNLISGNAGSGVQIGSASIGNLIESNQIGVGAGNGNDGVRITADAQDNTIGGDSVAAGNIITNNGSEGVALAGSLTTGNTIRANSIYGNQGSPSLGIDLGEDGVTTNGSQSGAGPNNWQGFPTDLSAATAATGVFISALAPASSSGLLTLDFYASSAANPSGYGPGKIYLGAIKNVAAGSIVQDLFAASVATGSVITATATDSAGDTSEFSAAVDMVTASVNVTPSSSANPSTYGQAATFTATVTPVGAGPTPTGTVQFFVGGVAFGSPVPLVNGSVSIAEAANLGAGSYVVQASYSGDSFYPTSSNSFIQVVNKAHLAIIPDNQSRPVGEPNPTLTAHLTGFVLGENATTAGVTGLAILTTTAGQGSPVGNYPITVTSAGTLAAANYDFPASFFGTGTLTLTATVPATVKATTGTPQSSMVGTSFTTAFQATVDDQNGNPLAGVIVTFAAPVTGASGTFVGGLASVAAITNASGIATAPVFTAGTAVGSYTVTASVSDVSTSASYFLTNTVGAAFSVSATTGTPQSTVVGTPFATAFQAIVDDQYGNPVPGAIVTFAAPVSGAGGNFSGSETTTAITNAPGVAMAPAFTANTLAGNYSVIASVSGVTSSASFSLSNTAGAASIILSTAGTPQSAIVGSAFTTALQATVEDQYGNPISGVSVTFTAPTSGASGTFAAGTTVIVTTNSFGLATAPAFVANRIAGGFIVDATISGVSAAASFSLTNTPGVASTIVTTAGTPQNAVVGTTYATTFQAKVTDVFGNPIGGVIVTFVAPATGPGGGFAGATTATATTNILGVATAPRFTANTIVGSYSVIATVSGVSSSASFSLTNKVGTAASITATAGTPQSAIVGSTFTTALQATVEDQYGNPISGMSVTFTAPISGASGTFAAGNTVIVTTNSLGVATAPAFAANRIAGSYSVIATVAGVSTSATFSLTNTPGAVSSIVSTAGTPQSTVVGTAYATALQAKVTDVFGNPISGAIVTFATPTSGASGDFAGATTVTTNSLGLATAPSFTANTKAGSYTVTAKVSSVSTSASFSLSNTPGAAASITATAGSPQSALAGSAFTTALQATVEDQYGNPISGLSVTFTAPASGPSGNFAGAKSKTVTTNSLGVATAPTLTAGILAGSYSVIVTDPGISSSASFGLTNTEMTSTTLSVSTSLVPIDVAETLTATVAPVAPALTTPTGSVSFYDGSKLLGSATINSSGQAVFTTSTLAYGAHSITATYTGVPAESTSTSKIVAVQVGDTVSGDYDGDGKSDIAIFDQTTATFYIQYSGGGTRVQQFGNPADKLIPVAGDYTGDGKDDLAIYDQTLAEFFILYSNGGSLALPFGNSAHVNIPVAGDYDGTGKTDIAIFDQTASIFYFLYSNGTSLVQPYGNPAHVNIPVAGDFNGGGKTNIAIYDQTAATFYVQETLGKTVIQPLGNASHVNVPIAADYDGDGKTDFAVYDQTAGIFYALESGGGAISQLFGNSADVNIPLDGDFTGDGKTDIAIYDATAGEFFILYSDGGSLALPFGNNKHKNLPV